MAIIELDVEQLDRAMSGTVTLVDVRMPDEFEAERVPGAVLVPLPELPDRVGEFPREETVFIICRSGNRSMTACEFLAAQGFETRNVAGGTLAWVESGRPTESGPAA